MATFATNDELKALQAGLASRSTAQLNQSRYGAYALIVSALNEGGYSVATITATPTVWGFLTLLETRMAALDLLGGGAASADALQGGSNWTHWEAQIKEWLEKLSAGKMALVNDSTGAITSPPKSSSNDGIEYEQRDPGVNLGAPETWPAADELEEWDS